MLYANVYEMRSTFAYKTVFLIKNWGTPEKLNCCNPGCNTVVSTWIPMFYGIFYHWKKYEKSEQVTLKQMRQCRRTTLLILYGLISYSTPSICSNFILPKKKNNPPITDKKGKKIPPIKRKWKKNPSQKYEKEKKSLHQIIWPGPPPQKLMVDP